MSDQQPKRRPDSLAAKLTPEQREELITLMVETGISLAAARDKCAREFKLDPPPSLATLSRFFSSERSTHSLTRARRLAEEIGFSLPELEEAERRLVAQQIFELGARPDTPPKVILRMKELHLKAAQMELDKKKLALAERKLAGAKEVIENTKLTPEQQRARLREILQ
jgi:hypothetical protein